MFIFISALWCNWSNIVSLWKWVWTIFHWNTYKLHSEGTVPVFYKCSHYCLYLFIQVPQSHQRDRLQTNKRPTTDRTKHKITSHGQELVWVESGIEVLSWCGLGSVLSFFVGVSHPWPERCLDVIIFEPHKYMNWVMGEGGTNIMCSLLSLKWPPF